MKVFMTDVATGEDTWCRVSRMSVLHDIAHKCACVLQSHLDYRFYSVADHDDDAKDHYERNKQKLTDIKNQKLGTGLVRDAILMEFRQYKENTRANR